MSNMVVQTNVLALNSHRALKNVGNAQSKSSARLSSGYKINSAADDAAGLAISEKMRAQIRGLDMASKNSQDAISLIQTAEGGMQEIDNMLQRVRELVTQASNDTNAWDLQSGGDRQKMQDEINQLVTEIDSMATRTEFNNKKVIDGSFSQKSQKPANEAALTKARLELDQANTAAIKAKASIASAVNDPTSVTGFEKVKADLMATDDYKNGVTKKLVEDGLAELARVIDEVRGASGANAAATVATALAKLGTGTGTAGAYDLMVNELNKGSATSSLYNAASKTAVTNLASVVTTMKTATTGVLASYGTAAATVNTKQVAYDAAKATWDKDKKDEGLYFQVGANANQKLNLSINSVTSNTLGIGDGNGKTHLDVVRASGKDITDLITKVDKAITTVTTERSKLGAAQNRLEYTIKSLDISSENLSASESRIRDTDMAKEMMNLTKANVLQQASTSMLAQANQAPQNVLQLLQ